MTFYSATAPAFTDEDVRREIEGLTDEERRELYQDMYGLPDEATIAIDGSPTCVRKSLTLLDEAIDSLSHDVKASYLLAKDLVPELVRDESPPLAFLRCEGFDPWAAANRLVAYWSFRTQLFGPHRAYLPMTLDDAMQEDYEDFMNHGLVFPVDDDSHGRVVVFWDRIRMSNVKRDVALRCAFYVLTKMVSRPDFSLRGFVVISNFQNCDLRKHYDRTLTKQAKVLIVSIPAKLKAVHICTGPGRSVTGLLVPVLRAIAGSYMRLRGIVHSGSGGDVLPYFKDYGLTETHIKVMYGLFSDRLARAQGWLLQQRENEAKARHLSGTPLEN